MTGVQTCALPIYIGPKMIINKTGTENMDLLNYNEVSTIFDNEISSVIKLIELVNFSDNKPQNHSFSHTFYTHQLEQLDQRHSQLVWSSKPELKRNFS